MSSFYDWVAIGIFAALIVLFLQRSTDEGPEIDSIWHYLPPSIGCALANYFGNDGRDLLAIAVLGVTLAYVWMVLKPLYRTPRG
ncbi:MAG: hypothetical protein JJE34_05510 [Alphaproteobacteria bacterium]|nr:hypothetical protein [Alphaproteobacteria bacterium]